jgi:DNA-binding transcriptional MerR regulator
MLSINELSEELGVSPSNLRKLEGFFSIPVGRNSKGNREYDEFTIDTFRKIKSLVAQGKTTKEVKILLNQGGASYTNQYNQNPRVEILEEKESQNQLILKPFIAQLDKAHHEIRELVSENAELKAKVKFFELKAQDHEKSLHKILEAKDQSIEILKEENTKKETNLKELNLKIEELNQKLNKKWWKFWE